MAVILSKFRKFKNFVTKFGSFGDSKKSDFSIWWSGSKADVLPDSIINIVNSLSSIVIFCVGRLFARECQGVFVL